MIGDNTTFLGNEELLDARGGDLVRLHPDECRRLIEEFIAEHRELGNEDIDV